MKTLLALFALLCALPLRAEDPLDFFPHHEGDTWVYNENTIIRKTIVTKDSIDDGDNIWIWRNNEGPFYEIDAQYYVHTLPYDLNWLEYKLDAHQDDTWTVRVANEENHDLRIEAWLTKEYQTFVLGKLTTVKEIAYFKLLPEDTVITNHSVYLYTQFLAAGIGVYKQIGEAGGIDLELLGCIINGQTLGDITSVDESIELEPISLSNYPNPCHSFTNVHFSTLAHSVRIEIMDILGNIVFSVPQENIRNGENSYIVNTSGWKPGIYFCRMTNGRQTVMRKIIVY